MDEVLEQRIAIFAYKYHFPLDQILSMTLQQMAIMEKHLSTILKLENGTSDDKSVSAKVNSSANTEAFGYTLKILKEKTGREKFTYEEVINPSETLRKYVKVK